MGFTVLDDTKYKVYNSTASDKYFFLTVYAAINPILR